MDNEFFFKMSVTLMAAIVVSGGFLNSRGGLDTVVALIWAVLAAAVTIHMWWKE